MEDTLTVEGAQLLREVRDNLLAYPETFYWANWCGSRCCIAGHVALIVTAQRGRLIGYQTDIGHLAACALGFTSGSTRELHKLFYGWRHVVDGDVTVKDLQDVVYAAEVINAFLVEFGYPVEEPMVPEQRELVGV